MKLIHIKEYPNFAPNLNPYEMIVLGVFGGVIFDRTNDIPIKLYSLLREYKIPEERYLSKYLSLYLNQYCKIHPELQIIKWFKWYCGIYYNKAYNKRLDKIMIRTWLGFKAENLSLVRIDHDHYLHQSQQRLLEIGVHYKQ